MSSYNNKLTVCMPVYNGAPYLAASISSVLTQTYDDFRLLICDDASTDTTQDIARSFTDRRLTYVRNPRNLGLVTNWNRSLALAGSEYIYLWHQDDLMMPDNLEKKISLLDANPHVGFVHSNVHLIDSAGVIIGPHFAAHSRRNYLLPGLHFFHCMISGPNLVSCPSVLARAACYHQLGGFRPELPYTCDHEMWMRISLYYDVACLAFPLISYRCHTVNESQRFLNTARELEQDISAKLLVLKTHGHRVPAPRALKARLRHDTAQKALDRATNAFYDDDFLTSWTYWWLAMNVRPVRLAERATLALFAKLLLGPRLVRFGRMLRRRHRPDPT